MEGILGQASSLDLLLAAAASGRVHHAWVFSGPRGVGKFTTAIEFAALLLDPDASVDDGGRVHRLGGDEVARQVRSGSHPDLHVVRKELALYSDNPRLRARKLLSIPIDLLREHVIGGETDDGRYHEAAAYRTSMRGHGKVFIVDEAELIASVGQDALLKTLEEPPAATYLILVTGRPDLLLPTIRSRCQHVRFGRLDDEAMQTWLERADLEVAPGERDWLLHFAEGSPGIAQLAGEYGFYGWSAELRPMLEELAAGRFPVDMGDTLGRLVEDFAAAWVKQNENASRDAANKDGARHLIALLATQAREAIRERVGSAADPGDWLDVVELLRDTERQIESNVNMKMAFENLAVQWARTSSSARAVSPLSS